MDLTFKELERTVHCFYNASTNEWCEYNYDTQMDMYSYRLYGETGFLNRGLIGKDNLQSKSPDWDFIGVL